MPCRGDLHRRRAIATLAGLPKIFSTAKEHDTRSFTHSLTWLDDDKLQPKGLAQKSPFLLIS
jgi:hypothetical protein